MVLIHVEYDAYTRQFKLVDRDKAHALIDGEKYVLLADVSVQDIVTEDESVNVEVVTA